MTILPDDAEIHAFVDQLTRFETESGVVVTRLDDTQARQRRSARRRGPSAFESITYKLTLRGTTRQLLAFMDLLENDYDRFVRIPTFEVQAFDDRRSGPQVADEVSRQHSIDLELETYVYNPKKRGRGHVTIPNEPRKLERLRDDGKLEVFASDVTLVRHEIEVRPNRRDPFVDPRVLTSQIDEEERRAQQDELEDLKGRFQVLRKALALEGEEANLVKRVQATDKNNAFLSTLAADVNGRVDEQFFTVLELAKEFETVVLGVLPLAEFGSPAQREAWLPRVVEGDAVLTAALQEDQADFSGGENVLLGDYEAVAFALGHIERVFVGLVHKTRIVAFGTGSGHVVFVDGGHNQKG